jgi:hypothetical protein
MTPPAERSGRPFGEGVLDDEVVCLLGVGEAGEVRTAGSDERQVVEALLLQGRLRLGGGVRRDAVDHGPGEAHLGLVGHIGDEAPVHESVLLPCLGDIEDRRAEMLAVAAEVVGRDHGDGGSPCLVAGKEQCRECRHRRLRRSGAGSEVALCRGREAAICRAQGIALLGDRHGDELELGALEVGLGTCPVLGTLRIREERICRGGKHALGKRAIGIHDDLEDIVTIRPVELVDREGAEGLHHHDAAGKLSCIDQVLGDRCMEGAVEVAASHMDPHRLLPAGLAHGIDVAFRQPDAVFLEFPALALPLFEGQHVDLLDFRALFGLLLGIDAGTSISVESACIVQFRLKFLRFRSLSDTNSC